VVERPDVHVQGQQQQQEQGQQQQQQQQKEVNVCVCIKAGLMYGPAVINRSLLNKEQST
jgi:hypothetical protein